MNSTTLWIAQSLASAFLGVLFLQSGLDKVLDWKGNREYITGYFAKTPLKMFTGPMFVSITILEVLTGVLSAAGSVTVLITQRPNVAFLGAVLAGLTILGLFFGQRIVFRRFLWSHILVVNHCIQHRFTFYANTVQTNSTGTITMRKTTFSFRNQLPTFS